MCSCYRKIAQKCVRTCTTEQALPQNRPEMRQDLQDRAGNATKSARNGHLMDTKAKVRVRRSSGNGKRLSGNDLYNDKFCENIIIRIILAKVSL